MANFLRNRVILISNEVFPLCPSAVMRVTSGYVCIAVIVMKDLSCLGRTNFLSNAVIVCRIDDLGRFVTRGQCAHSHPQGGNRPPLFRVRVADNICDSFFIFDGLLDILAALDSRVCWLFCVLWNPPDRAYADGTGNAPFAAQNLNTAGGDAPAFGGLRDG